MRTATIINPHSYPSPFPMALVIRAGKSLSEKSLANKSSTDDMDEDRRRQGEEGGVEQALSSLLPPASSCCMLEPCWGEPSTL